jgi:hypothetical protein
MLTEKPTEKQSETQTAEPQIVTREEFAKVAGLADALGANLRKEREAAAKRETELTKRFEELAARLEQMPQKPADDGKGEKTAETRAYEIAQAKSEQRIRELEAKTAAAEHKAAETEAKQREGEERQALGAALASHGIEGAKQRAALALLYTEEKKIRRDDKGGICFVTTQSYGEELISLEDGVKAWVGTDDGKSFLPPRGVMGSGTKATAANGVKHRMTKQEALLQLIPALQKAQNG